MGCVSGLGSCSCFVVVTPPPDDGGGDGDWGHPDPHGRQKYEVIYDLNTIEYANPLDPSSISRSIAKPYLLNLGNPNIPASDERWVYNLATGNNAFSAPGVQGFPPAHPPGARVSYQVTVELMEIGDLEGKIISATGYLNSFAVGVDTRGPLSNTDSVQLGGDIIGVVMSSIFLNAVTGQVLGDCFERARHFKLGVRITAQG